jgi:2-oxoglutarate dehydrogenase E2 component (dihydrolipoamide succinyltransferase)
MLRRKVAERLVAAKKKAMLTTFNEVNMTPINLIRNEYKDAFKSKTWWDWFRIHVVLYKAVTRALQLFPDVNSMMDGDHKIAFDFVIFQLQYQDQRIMVPVVRNAN